MFVCYILFSWNTLRLQYTRLDVLGLWEVTVLTTKPMCLNDFQILLTTHVIIGI